MSPWLQAGKRPKTAQNGPEWPTWSTHFLSGQRPIFGPPGRLLTHIPDTKRPQMARNGTENKKVALSEELKGGGNPLVVPRFRLLNRSFVLPLPGKLEGSSPEGKGNMLLCSGEDPSCPRRETLA